MPAIWNRPIAEYTIEAPVRSPGGCRAIRLILGPDAGLAPHTVSIRFPPVPPDDNMTIGVSHTDIELAAGRFNDLYRLLQTQQPLYFTAFEYDTLRFVGLTPRAGVVGGGFYEANL